MPANVLLKDRIKFIHRETKKPKDPWMATGIFLTVSNEAELKETWLKIYWSVYD